MPAYTISNTAGNTVATISVATTTGATFPIELVGQGISLYGPAIATTQYHLLENFSNSTAPVNPVTGMLWHNPSADDISYYSGTQFVPLGSPTTNSASIFNMLGSASNVNLATVGSNAIFTDPNDGSTYHITGMLLKVNGTPTATSPALVNLYVTSSEDVLENVSVNLPTVNQHGYYIVQGTTHVVTGGSTVNIEVTSAVTGGALNVDVYLFGLKT